jgi:hypothetical protein
MLEYNIQYQDNPERENPFLSKNCLCWHPGVIFNEKGNNKERDNFRREFEDNLEQGFAGHEVCGNNILNFKTCLFQKDTFVDQTITFFLLIVTFVSVCALFWYQNFHAES